MVEEQIENLNDMKQPDGRIIGTPSYSNNELNLAESRYFLIHNHNKEFYTNKIVFDYGCGYGYGTKRIADHGAIEVHGIDINPQAISLAKAKHSHPKVIFHEQDRLFAPPGIKPDIITAVEFVEHITATELDQQLKFWWSLLPSEKFLYITTPSLRGYKRDFPKGSHWTEYGIQELIELVKNYGFYPVWHQGTDLGVSYLFKKVG